MADNGTEQHGVCKVGLRHGAIVAEITGRDSAPSRSWNRERSADGWLFSRELTAAEAYRWLRDQEPPSDITDAHVVSGDGLQGITLFPKMAVPLVLVEDEQDQIRLSIALKHPSRAKILDFTIAPETPPKRGYTICHEHFVAFDAGALETILDVARKEGVDLLSQRPIVSFRHYQSLRRTFVESGVLLHEKVTGAEFVRRLQERLKHAEVHLPPSLKLKLYPYQEEGLRWLQFCYEHELGCLLADEMGLGKTPTAIGLMASTVSAGAPNLVVCPTTLLENWLRELRKFCPSLSAALHHGPSRLLRAEEFRGFNVVVTSYGIARNDIAMLAAVPWNVVVLDEAQKIKNPDSGVSVSCRQLKAHSPLAMTGTPFENHPLDLWSLMEFIEPGFLGTRQEFMEEYGEPIAAGDRTATEALESTVRLFMMRRLKKDVRSDLPPKIQIDEPVAMTASEAEHYTTMVAVLKQKARTQGVTANLITPLRQLCCHPKLLEAGWDGDPSYGCGKYQRLVALLDKIIGLGEKFLIFSSFLRMLDILEKDISDRLGIPVFRIDGGVAAPDRQPRVDSFSAVKGSAAMVLNPQAAGLGLNIVAANHVIHYNREWNPAVEDQATDRTHRGGQERDVSVHYLFYVDTVDQIISDRLCEKRQLAGQLVVPTADKESDRQAILAALDLLPTRTIEDAPDEDTY